MAERMTIAEIEASFPNEWILVVDPDTGPDLSIRSGIVAVHSRDRDEVDRTGIALKAKRVAVWFNGEPPEDELIIPSILDIRDLDGNPV